MTFLVQGGIISHKGLFDVTKNVTTFKKLCCIDGKNGGSAKFPIGMMIAQLIAGRKTPSTYQRGVIR